MNTDNQFLIEFLNLISTNSDFDIKERVSIHLYDLFKTDSNKYLQLINEIYSQTQKLENSADFNEKNVLESINDLVFEYNQLKTEEILLPELLGTKNQEKPEKNSLNKEKILKKIKKLESFIEEKIEIMSQEQNDANKLIGLISKSHIVEICQLRDPPNPVKAVLLSVCMLFDDISD